MNKFLLKLFGVQDYIDKLTAINSDITNEFTKYKDSYDRTLNNYNEFVIKINKLKNEYKEILEAKNEKIKALDNDNRQLQNELVNYEQLESKLCKLSNNFEKLKVDKNLIINYLEDVIVVELNKLKNKNYE